ncbi:hypothetical protein BDV97DRAFT_394283 [Delphinella strobiligena]|nr:hypothetical protein BDV97DRAFT_394283 [Delphinella strobiligena]
MNVQRELIIAAIALLTLTGAPIASAKQANSKEDCAYLAPLLKAEDCDERLDGDCIMLRDGGDLADHFEAIGRFLEADPFTDWIWGWIWDWICAAHPYHVTHLTEASLDHIRREWKKSWRTITSKA